MYTGEARKRSRARELFQECAQAGLALVSTQVVQEFYAVGSRKLGIPRHELLDATANFLSAPLVVVGSDQIRSAIELEERYQIAFWDALILAAAESGGAEIL